MTESPNDESLNTEFFARWRHVIQNLEALEGKNDQESNRLRSELLDELMCLDMALGPCRKAMIQAAKRDSERDQNPTGT